MLGYSGSGDTAYIGADIEASWFHYLLEQFHTLLNNLEELLCFLVSQVLQVCYMPVRGNHQMPRIVRKGVQDYEIVLTTKEDKVRLVIVLAGLLA